MSKRAFSDNAKAGSFHGHGLLPKDTVLVSLIQRGSVQDGPGLRTTIYLKGCPLRCPWCYNAESLHVRQELRFVPEFCLGIALCGRCLEACPSKALVVARERKTPLLQRGICDVCPSCSQVCPSQALTLVGKAMTAQEIVTEAERDKAFYASSGGGITLSGGEPLVRPALAASIVCLAKKRDLHTAIDTCGWFDMDDPDVRAALTSCDLLLFDLKHMDSLRHKACTHMDNARIVENLDRVAREFPHLPIWIRTPIVRGFNDNEQDVLAIARHVAQYPSVVRHELLPCLDIGEDKYAQLGMTRPQFASLGPSAKQLERLRTQVTLCRSEIRDSRLDQGGLQ